MPKNTNFDVETRLYEFECAIDTIDKIRDGLPDDRATSNALTAVHANLCGVYAEFKSHLLFE